MNEKKIVIAIDELGNPEIFRNGISIEDTMTILDISHAQLRIEITRNQEQTNEEKKNLNYPLQHVYPY